MQITSQIILKAFLQSCAPEIRDRLIRFLPEEEVEVLNHLEPPFQDPTHGLTKSAELIDSFHHSWFVPLLRKLSSSDLKLMLAAISSKQRELVSKELGFANEVPKLKKQAHTFLKAFLAEELKKDSPSLLPFECLPKSPFTALLYFSYPQKLKLIDLLSIHDLALELKSIIEKETLKHIKSILTKEEREYLKIVLKQKEHLRFKAMNLKEWDGNHSTLRTLLRQRGLNRLSKALFNADPSFLWYLRRQLDHATSELFQKLHTPLDNRLATKTLQEQVLNLIEVFKEQKGKS